jgi:hypothetical protein
MLPEEHELIKKELKKISGNKNFHQIIVCDDDKEDEIKTALSIRNQVTNLPIRVGQTISVITTSDQALEELTIICFLQRRFNEAIKIFTVRPTGRYLIPYIVNLREGEDDRREGMVNYNYPTSSGCGSCGGSCSSCG